jgi:transcriptional regulator with XRE-family HTH domain
MDVAGACGGPTVRRRLLGSHLRQLRERKGLTRAEAGTAIRGSESKISRLELGRLQFKERDVRDLLACYGVDDANTCEAIVTLAKEANTRGWWHTFSDVLPAWFEQYVGLESGSSLIRTYEAQFIPGLLQTEDYAHAVTRAGQLPGPAFKLARQEIERRVALRSERQQILTRPGGPRFWAVIDEGALQRQIGGPPVMRAQLEHLLQLQSSPNITIQIMPFRFGGHVAQVGAFTILRFDGDDLPDVVYLEHLTGALYLEARQDTDLYHEVFVQLAVDSLPPDDSAATIVRILSDG